MEKMAQIKETKSTTYSDYAHFLADAADVVLRDSLTQKELEKVRQVLRQTGSALQLKQELYELEDSSLSSITPEVERNFNRLYDSYRNQMNNVRSILKTRV